MDDDAADPTSELPADLVERLDQLDGKKLRAVISYAQQRYQSIHPSLTDQLEAGPAEEIIRIDEMDGYTEVVKRQPCAEGCEECPHGPFLYRVREEQRPDGETKLHWTYLGRVEE